MIHFDSHGPIIACSTGTHENSAIGIIRISSPDSLNAFNDSFDIDLEKTKARYATFCKLKHATNETIFDEILLLKFDAPHSYTGENILELHVHGNQLNIERIISYFVEEFGISLAKPGEFSYRAFLNKKLDTIQLEGLEQFLNATNNYALSQGLSGLNGELYRSYQNLKQSYLELRAVVEMGIDFIDDMGEDKFNELFSERKNSFSQLIDEFYQRTSSSYSSLLHPSIVLSGEPNAGKSTFFNNFLKFDRSIVSNIAGTTRDSISEYISLKGNNFKVIDTAGMRETADVIEQEGVARAKSHFENAFFKIQLFNLTDEDLNYHKNDCDLLVLTHCDHDSFPTLFKQFINKNSDLPDFVLSNLGGPIGPIWNKNAGPIEPDDVLSFGPIGPNDLNKSGPIGPENTNGPIEPRSNINKYSKIEEVILQKFEQLISHNSINSDRQRYLIQKLHDSWSKIVNNSSLEDDITLFSHEFNNLDSLINELLGITTPDNVLNHVFSNFCIGK